jgi:hypothetical protein
MAEIDRLNPRLHPARVSVTPPRGTFTRQAHGALGPRTVPLGAAGRKAKLVESVPSAARCERLWRVETAADVRPIVELASMPRS